MMVPIPNARLRQPASCERLPAVASKRHCNWRERFPSGCSPPKFVRTALTPDTVRQEHGAAIAEVERDESSGSLTRLSPFASGAEAIDIEVSLTWTRAPHTMAVRDNGRPNHLALPYR